MKLGLLLGHYLESRYGKHYHAKANNIAKKIIQAYDDALADVDVLALPTVPKLPYEIIPDISRRKALERSFGLNVNTAPLNITGHPAITLPCGVANDLPVGIMFVAPRGDDETLLRVASTFESTIDWQSISA
jgi:amidase